MQSEPDSDYRLCQVLVLQAALGHQNAFLRVGVGILGNVMYSSFREIEAKDIVIR